jgi:uncharacterized protein (DUF2252 family)
MLAPTEPAERGAVLDACRLGKMARSAHAFVRGSTDLFYNWLTVADLARDIPQGPPIWICGDCHIGNLGPLADAQGKVDIQIRDLDQTVIGNPAYDLIRLALSLASAARGSDLPGLATARIVEAMIDGYTHALDLRRPPDETLRPDMVRAVHKRALGRKWRHLARERMDEGTKLPIGKRFWTLSEAEREAIEEIFEQPDVEALLLRLSGRTSARRLRLRDAAYWVKGCSSLGAGRYAALLDIEGNSGTRSSALIDLKHAGPAVALKAPRVRMPRDNAERVVAGARALSPNLGDRMLPVQLLGQPYVLRELRPQDLKIEVDQFTRPEAIRAAHYLAYVVGRAHAAQLDDADRIAWAGTLRSASFGDLDAPPWLWRSVVKLMGRHEAAYLEHCRRYAIAGECRGL